MKVSKKLLAKSLLTALVAGTMVAGSTYALFTDNDQVNIAIQSGNVDVEAKIIGLTTYSMGVKQQEAGKFENGGSAKLNGNALELDLITPGDKVEFAIQIANNSNVKTQYQVSVAPGVDKGLFAGLVVEINDVVFSGLTVKTDWATLDVGEVIPDIKVEIELPKEAGNEFQGKETELLISVEAVQGNATVQNPKADEVLISKPAELVAFANTVNAGNSYLNKTVKLEADLDMSGVAYTPAGAVASFPGVTFKGTFDGQGHTISNLVVTDETPNYASAGLFGTNIGTIQNVILDNATVTSSHYAGGIVGYNYGAVLNCQVLNSSITSNVELLGESYDNGDKAGGIAGYVVPEKTAGSVVGCKVENTTIFAYRDLGGIVGFAGAKATVTDNTATDVTLVIDKDAAHNYKNYKQDAEHDLGQIIGEKTSTTVDERNTAVNVTETEKYVIKTAEELKDILTLAGSAGSGDGIIDLAADVDLTGETWSPVNVDGYNGADVITINGNDHTIKGLTAPLLAGGFAGGSGVIINDLTIADSTIGSANALGSGAFIECVDSMDVITLNNCHLLNSTVTGSRSGGLIGWTSGYNNENDGAVKTYVTIENCSVVGCTINGGDESVGAINGHAGANPWTYTTITNCLVKDNTLVGGTGKTGVILGTANLGKVTISGCTMENNTVNGVASDAVYGRVSFGTTGELTIDGVAVTNN